ncbi:hypothetical protein [Nocardiopsis prasina]|uniref:hypothetical protein n=1 Tax=Nocardiopsis prasina TaxID=2015 RepID=UPI000346C480|nr:hypothetical protein [Nocardiopsis prasina]
MSSPERTKRREVLWSPAPLLLSPLAVIPLGMLYAASSQPSSDRVGEVVAHVAACVLMWMLLATLFGRHVWIGSRRIQVNNALNSTRLALADVRSVSVGEWGEIILRLRDGGRVRVTSHLSGPRNPFPSLRSAERAAGGLRRAVRAAGVPGRKPVVVERARWPVPLFLGLSLVVCLAARLGFAQAP